MQFFIPNYARANEDDFGYIFYRQILINRSRLNAASLNMGVVGTENEGNVPQNPHILTTTKEKISPKYSSFFLNF